MIKLRHSARVRLNPTVRGAADGYHRRSLRAGRMLWLGSSLLVVACSAKFEDAAPEQTGGAAGAAGAAGNLGVTAAGTQAADSAGAGAQAGEAGAGAAEPPVANAGAAGAAPAGAAGAPALAGAGGAPGGDSSGAAGMPAMTSAGSSGAAGAAPDEPGVAPAASGLMVTANPQNVLSAIVTWTTDVAANSAVRFGVNGYQFVIEDASYTTDHRVLVIGMHAEQDYQLQAASTNASGSSELEATFTTAALPSVVSRPIGASNDAAAAQPGWTLTNLMQSNSPAVIVMYDQDGEPVWYHINGTATDGRGDVSVDLVDNDRVLIGPAPGEPPREIDLEGNVLWEGPSQAGGDVMTHHASKLSNGNYAVIRDVRDSNLQGTQVDELTPGNEVVWSWNIFDHLTPLTGANTDWCHGNAVTFNFDQDAVFLNCRFLGTIKIQYSGASDVLAHMGGTFDPTGMGDYSYVPVEAKFSDTHDPEFGADGTLLVYDNGGFSSAGGFGGPEAGTYHSRVIEYQLDEVTKTATRIWEFPGEFETDPWYKETWYSPYWGDADRLENGNVLIDGAIRSGSESTHIFEVRPSDGAVVWEVVLPTNVGSYRAERLSPPPLVRPYVE